MSDTTNFKKRAWEICMDNAEAVRKYDFSHLNGNFKTSKLPTKTCPRCDGRGYKKQQPGEYGLCECPSCGGSGKVIGS